MATNKRPKRTDEIDKLLERYTSDQEIPQALIDMKTRFEEELALEKKGEEIAEDFIDKCPKMEGEDVPESLRGGFQGIKASFVLAGFFNKIAEFQGHDKEGMDDLDRMLNGVFISGMERFLGQQIINSFPVFYRCYDELVRRGAVGEKNACDVIGGKIEAWVEKSDIYQVLIIHAVNGGADDNRYVLAMKKEETGVGGPDFAMRTCWPRQKSRENIWGEKEIVQPSLNTYREHDWVIPNVKPSRLDYNGFVADLEDVTLRHKVEYGMQNMRLINLLLWELRIVRDNIFYTESD